jgi:hypothetical protein
MTQLQAIDLEAPAVEVVSYSEIDTYRQCALKHQLSYMERWRKTGEEAEPLVRGTLFHSVMEKHYGWLKGVQDGIYEDDAVEDLFLAVAPLLYEEGTGAQSDRQALVEWIYRGYVDLYQTDPDWDIIGIEVPVEFPMYNRHGEESRIVLKGTTDLLVRDRSAGGGLWIVDHKTCRNLPKQKDFDMEDQTGIYTFLMKQNGMDIRGAIYNHCRTEKLKTREMDHTERFKRTLTVRSDQELFRLVAEAEEQISEAYGRELHVGTPDVRDAPRTPDGERCGWKCGYTEACLAGRKLGPERTRTFLKDIDYAQFETKPGPTFNK